MTRENLILITFFTEDISNSVSICPEIRPGEDDLPGKVLIEHL